MLNQQDILNTRILDAANKINTYTKGMNYEQFIVDHKTVNAVVRNFDIIGNATKCISEDLKYAHQKIQWREIVDFTNKLYMSISE